MSEHTPGPWKVRQQTANLWRIERKRKGLTPVTIGLAATPTGGLGAGDPLTGEANANLMARACEIPDLEAENAKLNAIIDLAVPRTDVSLDAMREKLAAMGYGLLKVEAAK